MPVTRMDRGTAEDWQAIAKACGERQRKVPERIKELLLQLAAHDDGFPINQLQHCLQTATRALRDHASEQLVVAALCHDIGKCVSSANHAAISAEILKPFVSNDTYEVIRAHQEFQGRFYFSFFGQDPDVRWKYRFKGWYQQACRFSDQWDQKSFDPNYDTLPLSFFEPMIERVFSTERPEGWQKLGRLNLAGRVFRKVWKLWM
jgi:predicted HD phosphohydrolase